MLLNDMTH